MSRTFDIALISAASLVCASGFALAAVFTIRGAGGRAVLSAMMAFAMVALVTRLAIREGTGVRS